ncbi:MAG: hypothetical protein V3V67_02130 [Myxococcota bacterium]
MATERSEPRPETELQEALNSWLREELGIEESRRVVRSNERRIVVSKVDAELAPDLFQLVELTPELFDPARVDAAHRERAVRVDPATPRAENWRAAMQELLQAAGRRHDIHDARPAEVRVGIDSVFAVLESVLWSHPSLGESWTPHEGENAAFRECLSRLDPARDLFRRYYGHFAGRSVENHCLGAALARELLEGAWRACTGTAAPSV